MRSLRVLRQFKDADGRPVTMGVVQPYPDLGSTPGLINTTPRRQIMVKADKDGVYVLNGHRFRIRAGDPLPVGAEMDKPVPEKRAEPAPAPENRAKSGAPENRGAPTPKAG